MLKYLIIAAWITPGILLFLYLIWISKRRDRKSVQLELPLTHLPGPTAAKTDSQELE